MWRNTHFFFFSWIINYLNNMIHDFSFVKKNVLNKRCRVYRICHCHYVINDLFLVVSIRRRVSVVISVKSGLPIIPKNLARKFKYLKIRSDFYLLQSIDESTIDQFLIRLRIWIIIQSSSQDCNIKKSGTFGRFTNCIGLFNSQLSVLICRPSGSCREWSTLVWI